MQKEKKSAMVKKIMRILTVNDNIEIFIVHAITFTGVPAPHTEISISDGKREISL